MSDKQLDLRGLECPLPALKTRKILKTMVNGETVRIFCTDPLALIDIPHLLHQTGDVLEATEKHDGEIIFTILRNGSS